MQFRQLDWEETQLPGAMKYQTSTGVGEKRYSIYASELNKTIQYQFQYMGAWAKAESVEQAKMYCQKDFENDLAFWIINE